MLKKFILPLVFSSYFSVSGQSLRSMINKELETKSIIQNSLFIVAGASDGLAESLKFHYSGFKKVFPKANDNYFNPSISWRNKWKNGDYLQGEKFPFSSTALVFTTDAYHLSRFLRNTSLMAGVTLNIGENKSFKEYLFDFVVSSFSYSVGFNITYELLDK